MIGRLKGVVDFIGEEYLILDVNGVGYRVFCSGKTLSSLSLGIKTILLIETNVKEDRIHLFGFLSELDKVFYGELCKINGVGNKVALKVMSVLTTDEITFAAQSEDKVMFARVPGIGPKLAQRIATELKTSIDKVFSKIQGETIKKTKQCEINTAIIEQDENTVVPKDIEISIIPDHESNFNKIKDAVSALENLGYKRNTIYSVVTKITKEKPDITLETLITESLKQLSSC